MTPKEKKKIFQNAADFLTNSVVDFMYLVAKVNEGETEEQHGKRVDEKYKELNNNWKLKCQAKENKWMKMKSRAFADAIALIVSDANKNQVAGVNAPLRTIDKAQTAKIIKLIS